MNVGQWLQAPPAVVERIEREQFEADRQEWDDRQEGRRPVDIYPRRSAPWDR